MAKSKKEKAAYATKRVRLGDKLFTPGQRVEGVSKKDLGAMAKLNVIEFKADEIVAEIEEEASVEQPGVESDDGNAKDDGKGVKSGSKE